MLKYISPIILLIISNVFMTFAWYGHLKHRSMPLLIVILVSWGIAFFEYEKYGKNYKKKADKVIPAEFFFKIQNGKDSKNSKSYNLLNSFKLSSVIYSIAYSVCRHLKTVFKKRNSPAYKDYN